MSSPAGPQQLASLLNAVGAVLPLGEPVLDFDGLVARAADASGCAPPEEGRYRAPLRALTEDAAASETLSLLGRRMLSMALGLRLHNHFAIERWLQEHPEVLDEPIERPVFIVSLPRTGTTMLHRLLSAHPAHRALYTWEMDRPVPSARQQRSPAARRRISAASIQLLHLLCPDLKHIHDVQAGYPEECINLLANELTSMIFTLFYELPRYANYLNTADLEPAYRAHRRQLQLLQHGQPRRRWVLKAPFHLLGLDALLRVYPDALIVQTHRDPTELVASEASLFLSIRRAFHTGIDLHRLGRERFETLGLWIERALQAREAHPSVEFIDIHYKDMVRDPLPWAEAVSARLGGVPDEDARAAMQAHMARHRQHRHGKHRYALAPFGLDEAEVRSRFAPYVARFLP